ncbi:MAG TPA: S1 RNA-binding domain-containing protein [Myxococcota bacterium]|nr:S1 RNA-binding domain-containing protein [Myxococcota bacterium]
MMSEESNVTTPGEDSEPMPPRLAEALATWERIAQAQASGAEVEGEVVAMVKGGLSVDVGMRAFLPASQVGLRPVSDLAPLVGQKLKLRVMELDKRRGALVVSRRALLEVERSVQRDAQLKTLNVGDVVEGTVASFVGYGAFVDIGGLDALLRNEDMSWGHVRHGTQVFAEGDAVKAKVIEIDRAKGRVALSVKQLSTDPWAGIAEKYPVGKRIQAKVLRLTEFGAFVEIEPNVEALVHVSEMRWGKSVRKPSEVVQKGQTIEAQVLEVDMAERRMALGMRQLTANPWKTLREKYRPNDRIKGTVRSITEFGAFVTLDDVGIDGLLHASDMAWNDRVKPAERYKVGDAIEVALLDVSVDNERISLGVKQLTEDPWVGATRTLKPGDKVKGKVTQVTEFGAFVELVPEVQGLCHVTELTEERGKRPADVVKVGDELEVRVLDVDASSRRIALSAFTVDTPVEPEKPKAAFKNSLADKLGALKVKE